MEKRLRFMYLLVLTTTLFVFTPALHSQTGTLPVITQQPADASICEGGSYTFTVLATGDNLDYQWYKGNNLILGAFSNQNELTISNATKDDYELYYVVIKNDVGTTVSNKARLWVAAPLPEQIAITKYPNPAIVGTAYTVAVEGHTDVTNYSWGYSLDGAIFNSLPDKEDATVVFLSTAAGNGVLSVNLEHVCGNRTVTQNISVKYPAGIDNIANNKVWIGPNPTTTELTIENGDLKIDNVVIMNASGHNIYQAKPNTANLQINTTNWPKGIYFVRVTTGLPGENNSKVYKVIKK